MYDTTTSASALGTEILPQAGRNKSSTSSWRYDWCADQIKLMRELALAGQNARQIADALARKFMIRRSRNSIIGKAHREGVTIRCQAKPPARVKPTAQRRPKAPPKPQPVETVPSIEDLIDEALRPLRFEDGASRTILSAGPDECRFPYGERENLVVCGRPVACGAYCVAHADICYVPSREAQRKRYERHALWYGSHR